MWGRSAGTGVWLLAAGLAVAGPITPEAKQEVVTQLQEVLSRRAYVGGVDFGTLRAHLEKERPRLDRAQTEEAFAAALQMSLVQFGISHVAIMPPRVLEAAHKTAEVGIGAATRPAPGGLRVLGVPSDSPAAKAGLKGGDIIIEVDGHRAEDASVLEGPSGSEVVLRVRRLSGQIDEVRVTRRLTDRRTRSTLRRVSDRTVMIRIPSFAGEYVPTEIESLFDEAFESENLILDLRGNGGGAVTNMSHLLGFFLPEGTPVGTPVSSQLAAAYVGETGEDPADAAAVAAWSKDEKFRAGPNLMGPYPGRVAVLIDGGSASASEVTSSALREVRGVVLVGSKSAGALLVSMYVDLPQGFTAQIPICDYITVKGFRPEGTGIEPDIQADRGDAGVKAAQMALEK